MLRWEPEDHQGRLSRAFKFGLSNVLDILEEVVRPLGEVALKVGKKRQPPAR